MNFSVRPPDFYRLFTQDGPSPLEPPPPPPHGAVYTQFGGSYPEPSVFVAPLSTFGRQQIYDERCLTEPATPDDLEWPTPQSELRRCVHLSMGH